MTETWRCFVGVPIGDELRTELAAAIAGWGRDPRAAEISWSRPGGWHLTLAFMGATPASRATELVRELEAVAADEAPFVVRTGGVGGFPSARRARVAWYGVDDPDGRVARLAAATRRVVGVVDDRFHPHLTIGRARGGAPVDLTAWIDPTSAPDGTISIERMVLYRSHTGTGPARYEELASVPIGAAVRA